MDMPLMVTCFAAFRIATPLCLAGLGGLCSERSGKANIALEGMMLSGAFAAAACLAFRGSAWMGVWAGVVGGLILASLHALSVVGLGVNALLSGVVMNLLAAGVTDFLYFSKLNEAYSAGISSGLEFPKLPGWQLPGLSWIWPDLPPLSLPVYLAAGLVLLSHLFFYRTTWGLRWRAVGESIEAARSCGIRTRAYQVAGILMSGALAGLAGAYLAFHSGQFVRGMSAGRGFVALAAIITGNWKPLPMAAVCLFLAGIESLQMNLSLHLPFQLLQASPYLITLLVLAGLASKSKPPAGLSA